MCHGKITGMEDAAIQLVGAILKASKADIRTKLRIWYTFQLLKKDIRSDRTDCLELL